MPKLKQLFRLVYIFEKLTNTAYIAINLILINSKINLIQKIQNAQNQKLKH